MFTRAGLAVAPSLLDSRRSRWPWEPTPEQASRVERAGHSHIPLDDYVPGANNAPHSGPSRPPSEASGATVEDRQGGKRQSAGARVRASARDSPFRRQTASQTPQGAAASVA